MAEKIPSSRPEKLKGNENPGHERIFKRHERKGIEITLDGVSYDLRNKEKWSEEDSKKAIESLRKAIAKIEDKDVYSSFPEDVDFSGLKFDKSISSEKQEIVKRIYLEKAMEIEPFHISQGGYHTTYGLRLDENSEVDIKIESQRDLSFNIRTEGEPAKEDLLIAIEDKFGKPLMLEVLKIDRPTGYSLSEKDLGFEAWDRDLFVRFIPFKHKKKEGPYR